MSELSKLERERNEAYNEWQECCEIVKFRRSRLERAEADERAAYARHQVLVAAVNEEQEKEQEG